MMKFPSAFNSEVYKRRPAAGGELFNRKRGFIIHSLASSPIHRPNMTEILFKRMEKLQVIHSQRNEYEINTSGISSASENFL